MAEQPTSGSIEVVRGRLDDERAEQILRFWDEAGALSGEAARERLPEVICVLLDEAGEVAGVNSAVAESMPLIGNLTFWIYRSFIVPEAASSGPAMIAAAFAALEEEFDPEGGGPIGLCLALSDPAEIRRRPEAEWRDPRMIYAGYLPEGRQLRIGYFEGAKIA